MSRRRKTTINPDVLIPTPEPASEDVIAKAPAHVFDFDRTPDEVKNWNDTQLKHQITRLISVTKIDRIRGVTTENAKKVYDSVLDTALGSKWEDVAGRPALRVLNRYQLERVYTVASQLYGKHSEALVAFLLARHKALRG